MTGNPQSSTEAQGATTTTPADGERRFTEAEYKAMRRNQLADADMNALMNKVIELEASNYKLRQRETPDGGKALTPDEAKEWEAYRALGKKPADLKTAIESGEVASRELGTLKQEQEIAGTAGVAKANPGVLRDILTRHNLTAKVQGEAPAAGQEDKRAVHLFDKDGKDVGEARTWAVQHEAAYVPALFPTMTAQPAVSGTVVSPQAGGGSAAPAGPKSVEQRTQELRSQISI